MKKLKTIAIALLVAFGTNAVSSQNKKINLEKSNINWVGEKVTGKHSGTINFKDGGSLVCSLYENPCTGKVVNRTFQPNFYPTSDSDVPGPIQPLYWDPKIQTWYPKVRRIMNNSTNKWPVNYKLLRSAIHSDNTIQILNP
jgi:hypothetical protein